MKTTLPQSIETAEQAKQLLTNLYNNGESFHPEDDATDIEWATCEEPTEAECILLNKLMADIYDLPGNENPMNMAFDPCEFLLSLDVEYSTEG